MLHELVHTQLGDFYVLANKKDRTSQHIRKGTLESWLQILIQQYADFNKVALDIGSNLGFHTVCMSKYYKRVLGFEPQKYIAELSKQTFKYNNISNISIYNIACAEGTGLVKLPRIDYASTVNCGGISLNLKDRSLNTNTGWDLNTTVPVASKAIDDVLIDSSEKLGFVKMDVEGYEYMALQGMKRLLKEAVCPVVVELKDYPVGNIQKVIDLMVSYGYNKYTLKGRCQWDYLFIKR